MFRVAILALCATAATAFVSAPAAQTTSVARFAYVPDGLSAAEYEASKKAAAAKKVANKKKFPKGNMGTDVKVWLNKLDQIKAGETNIVNSGHTYAKTKFDWTGKKDS